MNKANLGDSISLLKQQVKVEKCYKCGRLMANIDANELQPGDLISLKQSGVSVSNPETKDLLCVHCEFIPPKTVGRRIADWFDSNDDDDSSFFSPTRSSSSGGFFGGGGFGGFGGFGGGGFGGGGAARGF